MLSEPDPDWKPMSDRYQKSILAAKISTKSAELENLMRWSSLTPIIPYIQFNPDWLVKIIPPSSGSTVRFLVKGEAGNVISIFLDCYDVVGYVGRPYWEIFPYKNGIKRIGMEHTGELYKSIKDALDMGDNLIDQLD